MSDPLDPLQPLLDAMLRADLTLALRELTRLDAALADRLDTDPDRVRLEVRAAQVLRYVGRLDESHTRGLRAVRASRLAGLSAELAAGLAEVAGVERQRRRPTVAVELLREAVDCFARLGPSHRARWLMARVSAATVLSETGRVDAARAELRQLVEEHTGAEATSASAAWTFAHLAELEPPEAAAALLDDGLRRSWVTNGDLPLLRARGRADLRAGRPAGAAQRFRELLDRFPENDQNVVFQGRVALDLARAERDAGRFDAAEAALSAAAAWLGNHPDRALVDDESALLAADRGAPRARSLLHRALLAKGGQELGAELRLAAMRDSAHHGRWAEFDDHADGLALDRREEPEPRLALDLLRTAQVVARTDSPRSGRELRVLGLLPASRAVDDPAVRERLRALGEQGAPVPAGPFDLLDLLGTGAIGEVWRARHHRYGTEVAVKVLTARSSTRPRVLALFEAEIRAAATLDHPYVVRTVDTGRIDAAAEAVTAGRMRAGTPWFAMELVAGGSLQASCGRVPWAEARELLTELLEALGHAHARGVLHLDVKPLNVLVDRSSTGRRVALADFGLAGLRQLEPGKIAGSPWYMAPEQLRGHTVALGPWTDLYGVGCLAVELVRGRPPFDFSDPSLVRNAQLFGEVPALEGVCAVPAGLDEWLGRLLAKSPAHRFGSAAEARAALRALPEAPARPQPAWAVVDWPSTVPTVLLDAEDTLPPEALEGPTGQALPVPPTWHAAPSGPGVDLLAAGQGLVALRRPPLVGRHPEQQSAWEVLREVVTGAAPRVLVVSGAPGSGRTALLRWLGEQAAEDVGARTLTGALGAESDTFRGALAAWLEGRPDEVAGLDAAHRSTLAAYVAGTQGLGAAAASVARALAGAAGEVPRVVLLLGEPWRHPGLDALVGALAAEPGRVVLGVRAAGGEGPRGHAVRRLELGSLRPKDLEQVVRHRLPLAPGLCDALVSQAGGNPGFVVEVLERLAQGPLVPGRRGLLLPRGRTLDLPVGLEAAWRERLEDAAQHLPAAAVEIVTLVALLGPHAETDTLARALALRGLEEVMPTVLPALEERRILERRPRGSALASGLSPDLVRTQAEEGGVLGAAALGAAWALAETRTDPAREGRLRVLAGDLAGALEPLLDGATEALSRTDLRTTASLLDERDLAAARLGGDPAGLRPMLIRAHAAALQGDQEAEERWIRAAAERLTEDSTPSDHAEVAVRRASLAVGRLDLVEADRQLVLAVDGFLSDDNHRRAVAALESAASVARAAGRLTEAAARLNLALDRVAQHPDPDRQLTLELHLGAVRLQQGHRDEGLGFLTTGYARAKERGLAIQAANAALALGDDARHHGDPGTAEVWYDRAYEATHLAQTRGIADLNAAMAAIATGRLGRAAQRLARAARSASPRFGWLAAIVRLVLVAESEDDHWRSGFAEATEALDVSGLRAEPDAAWCFEQAGLRAARGGHAGRAAEALAMAAELWTELGRPLDAARVQGSRP